MTTTTFITLTSHNLKRNIPSAISAAAIKRSMNFAEKTTRQISAAKNAIAANMHTAFGQFRLLLLRIHFTSLAEFLWHYIQKNRNGYNILKKALVY